MLRTTRFILCFALLMPFLNSNATPDVAQILRTSSSGIVTVQAIQWVKIKVPAQYKGITQDPVYQIFSRIFSDTDTPVTPTTDAAPVIKKKSSGSGFIIAPNGVIVTNYHTVVGANEIYVQFSDKRRLKATLLRSEPKRDLAILKVAAGSLPALPLATDVSEGEWVIAIGANKAGASSGTVINSPTINAAQGLVTDVDISDANTGGPLLNVQGEALAMNSNLLKASTGLTRHVVVSKLVSAKDLNANLPQTWQQLGFTALNVTKVIQQQQALPNATGAWVKTVQTNSIAAKSGLQANDVIIALESQKVVDISDLTALRDFLSQDNEVNMTVIRSGEPKVLRFVVAKATPVSNDPSTITWERLGIKAKPLNATQKATLNVSFGLQITAVQKGAADVGLHVGDYIFGINQQNLNSVEQLNSVIDKLPVGETVFIYISQENTRQFVGVVLE